MSRRNQTILLALQLAVCLICNPSSAQLRQAPALPSGFEHDATSAYFQKEADVGSRYLMRHWSPGQLELSDHTIIPRKDSFLLFNFDKLTGTIYSVNKFYAVRLYTYDSIVRFEIAEERNFAFEKVPVISREYFLIPIITSARGYSFFKHLVTKLRTADYVNGGYYSSGTKSDEYVDDYEYFIVYPGNGTFKKIMLKEKDLRKAMKPEKSLVDTFFDLHDHDINEQSVLAMIQYINDQKYPD